jgi:hypothetical protein
MPDSTQVPGYDRTLANREPPGRSGTGSGGDLVTSEPGQYPPVAPGDTTIFGGPLPTGTGAPGTAGGDYGGPDTSQAGQLGDSFTGLSRDDITDTGAPGTDGADIPAGAGPDTVKFTRPGSYLSGSYAQDTVRGKVDGPAEWTEANSGGYGTDGPKLPGMKEPTPDGGPFQPGSGGRVMRGGRAVRG